MSDEYVCIATHPDQFKPGDRVAVFSAAGPCLTATLFKINRVKAKVSFFGYALEDERKTLIHKPGSCRSCQSHPQTQYPDGYMD